MAQNKPHRVTCDIFQAERPEEMKSKHLDFLDILLTAKDEDGRGLTDIEVRSEVDTFLFEGNTLVHCTSNLYNKRRYVCLSVCIYVPCGRPNSWADGDQT